MMKNFLLQEHDDVHLFFIFSLAMINLPYNIHYCRYNTSCYKWVQPQEQGIYAQDLVLCPQVQGVNASLLGFAIHQETKHQTYTHLYQCWAGTRFGRLEPLVSIWVSKTQIELKANFWNCLWYHFQNWTWNWVPSTRYL